MPKLSPTLALLPTEVRGFNKASFKFNKALNAEIKQIPGVTWDGENKRWLVPEDVCLKGVAEQFGLNYQPHHKNEGLRELTLSSPGLYPFQKEVVAQALETKSHLIASAPGLGKTAIAVSTLKESKKTKALIVCPANVRLSWKKELQRWGDLSCQVISKGSQWTELAEDIIITSYGLLNRALEHQWDFIVYDEGHYISNPKSERSKLAAELSRNNLDAYKLILTATPVKNQIIDLWHMFYILWPLRRSFVKEGKTITFDTSRYGTKWQFAKRYCIIEKNNFGTSIKGLNPLFEEELRGRLERTISRVTRAEVAHLLPPITLVPLIIEPPEMAFFGPQLLEDRVKQTIEWVKTQRQNGITKHVVITRHRPVAKAIAQALESITTVTLVRGDVDEAERKRRINEIAELDDGIVVATMESVGIGINELATFYDIVFVELHPSPEKMLQMLGRFGRLNSKMPATITLLTYSGTEDERMSDLLYLKIAAANKVIKSGVSEQRLQDALANEDNWLEELGKIADTYDPALEGDFFGD